MRDLNHSVIIILYIMKLLCSGFAFFYGVKIFFQKRAALYAQIEVCAMGCFMLSHLFELAQVFVTGAVPEGFHVGNLGLIGGMAFLFSASFGQMDGLVDDRSPKWRKYRWLALLAPIGLLGIFLPSLFGSAGTEMKAVSLVQLLFIAAAAYYNLKHVIFPDIELGIIRAIRGFNLTVLLLQLFMAAELAAGNWNSGSWRIITAVLILVTFLILIPQLKQGVRKWTI